MAVQNSILLFKYYVLCTLLSAKCVYIYIMSMDNKDIIIILHYVIQIIQGN